MPMEPKRFHVSAAFCIIGLVVALLGSVTFFLENYGLIRFDPFLSGFLFLVGAIMIVLEASNFFGEICRRYEEEERDGRKA